jgi:hypothetical protein
MRRSRDRALPIPSSVRWLAVSGMVLGLLGGLVFGISLFFPYSTVCLDSGCQTLTAAHEFFSLDANGPLKCAVLAVTALLGVPAFPLLGTRFGWVAWAQALAALPLLTFVFLGQFATLGGALVLLGCALLVWARVWFLRHRTGT